MRLPKKKFFFLSVGSVYLDVTCIISVLFVWGFRYEEKERPMKLVHRGVVS